MSVQVKTPSGVAANGCQGALQKKGYGVVQSGEKRCKTGEKPGTKRGESGDKTASPSRGIRALSPS